MVPTFTMESIDEGGARLYPDSIATTTPQAFTVASPPAAKTGFGVDTTHLSVSGVTHCTPAHIRQVRAGSVITERRPLVHSRYTF